MHNPLFLRTDEKDSRKLQLPVRGARHWTVVEVPGDVWYMVEGNQLTSFDRADIKRFITTSLQEALDRMRGQRFLSASLFAYVREPTSFVSGHFFQRVKEVHRFDQSGELLLYFSKGVMVTIKDAEMSNTRPLGVGQRIYPWLPPPS